MPTRADYLKQWQRGSIHPELGRMTFEDWTAMAGHDDNHFDQLRQALRNV